MLRQTIPPRAAEIDHRTDEGRAVLREAYTPPAPEYVRLNMVTSLTGAAAGEDGTSETLTSRADRTILGIIRAHADVVLVGAASVRTEGYVVPRTARLAVVTASGDLDGHRLDLPAPEDRDRVLVLCAASRAHAIRARLSSPGLRVVPVRDGSAQDGMLAPAAILAALRSEGLSRVVCEGGPELASAFAAADAIDEYCITVAPRIGPAERPFLTVDADHAPRTHVVGQLTDDDGFTYLRLKPVR